MIDYNNIIPLSTTIEIIKTHEFVHCEPVNFYYYKNHSYKDYQCINCKVLLTHDLYDNNVWFDSKIFDGTDLTCNEYIIYNIFY